MNPKQLHLVAGEDNEPKNTAIAWKNRNDVEQQQVRQSQGGEMKRTKTNGKEKGVKKKKMTEINHARMGLLQ